MSGKVVNLAQYRTSIRSGKSEENKTSDLLSWDSEISFNIVNHVKALAWRCISPINRSTDFWEYNDRTILRPNMRHSVEFLERMYNENKLNFSVIKSLKEHVNYLNWWLFIWNIFWNLDYIFHADYQKWKEELSSIGLQIPSVEDFEYCSSFMPWKSDVDKLVNLFGLLWIQFIHDSRHKIWTSDTARMDIWKIWLNPNMKSSIQKILSRIERLISWDKKAMKVLFADTHWYDFHWECIDKIYLICWIKK